MKIIPILFGGIILGVIVSMTKSASASELPPSQPPRQGPFPFQRWADYFGVPIEVVAGVARTESRRPKWPDGYPKATNLTGGDLARGGAWGLCQMTLQTAVGLVLALKKSQPSLKPYLNRFDGTGPSLFDPDLNVLLACALLKSNFKAMGTWPNAVLAYNRGVGGARKYLATAVAQSNVYVQRVYA